MESLKGAAWALTACLCAVVMFFYYSSTAVHEKAEANTLITRGLQLHNQGDVEGALRNYEAAAAADPNSAVAFYDIGVARYQRGEIDLAVAGYRRAIELNPKHADAHYNLGYIYAHKLHDINAALREFRSAAAASPAMAKSYVEMGSAYSALGFRERALSSWQLAVRIDPSLRDFVATLSKSQPTGSTTPPR